MPNYHLFLSFENIKKTSNEALPEYKKRKHINPIQMTNETITKLVNYQVSKTNTEGK